MIRVGPDCDITLVFRDVFDSSSRNLVFFMFVHLFLCASFLPSIAIRFSVRQSPRLRVSCPSQFGCVESLGRMRQIPSNF